MSKNEHKETAEDIVEKNIKLLIFGHYIPLEINFLGLTVIYSVIIGVSFTNAI